MDLARLSLNTATVKQQCNLQQAVDLCLRHNISCIAPWRDQIHDIGLDKASKIINNSGLNVSSLCRGGMFPQSNKQEFKKNIQDNYLAIDEAVSIGSKSLVLVVGGLPKNSKDIQGARQQVENAIREILLYAEKFQMPLGIEPLHPMYAADRACINTVQQAIDLCNKINHPLLGIVLDIYHIWWDPVLEQSINNCRGKIFGYHTCDWHINTSDMLLDRAMMGDGIVDIKQISQFVQNNNYKDFVEVEIFSKNIWWKKEPNEIARIIKERFQNFV